MVNRRGGQRPPNGQRSAVNNTRLAKWETERNGRLTVALAVDYGRAMFALARIWHSLRLRKRYHLLNYLARKHGYARYLEIGVRNPKNNFNRIRVAFKEAVDPAPLAPIAHTMKSDDFFAKLDATNPSVRYDMVFIDGLHIADQVERDVVNSLRYLNPGGVLVLHDCNPPDEQAQVDHFDGTAKVWVGTVWKAWAKLRATRADLSMCVVDIDLGCGVIRTDKQACIKAPATYDDMSYAFLSQNRREILNLVSVDRFLTEYS